MSDDKMAGRGRMRLDFDAPEELPVHELIEFISAEVARGDESGEIEDGTSGLLSWELSETRVGLEIDRRQRLAAAALLMAFDLPQEMRAAAATMLEAASVCPGMTTGDMAPMGSQGRRAALEFARRLVDEMLSEMPGEEAPHA